MLTFEQTQEALSRIVEELPEQIFERLNGGIILLPETKLHPKRVGDDLYIMGEYHYDPQGLGRYITIYYGSLVQAFGYASEDRQIKELRDVLHHELIHHLEHMAGDKSLEKYDNERMSRYLQSHRPDEDGIE